MKKQIQLAFGTIEYEDVGKGYPIVLLHGALCNSYNWEKVLAPLAQHYRCLAPTLPLGGHHLPMNGAADLTPPGIANLLAEFIEALELESVVLIGNDTGGAYAQVFAATFPDKVAGLVLSNCDALDVFPPAQFASLKRSIDIPFYTDLMALLFQFKPFLTTKWVLGLLANSLSKETIYESYIKSFVGDKRIRNDFKKVVRGWSTRHTQEAAQKLARLDKSTLLLWSADEKLFPISLAERLHKALPSSQLVLVNDALTYMQVDQPERFVEYTLEFLSVYLAEASSNASNHA